MGRHLSPVLRRELANLDKDPHSRKSAMKALKSYVKDLDSNAIPSFLAQVSETKEIGSLSGEYTISLYEVLARVHGVNIVSQVDSIMDTIVKTLSSSAGSFPLQQACSKVIPAIARYGIDPSTGDDKKRHVIHSLCKPLVAALLGIQDSLTSGAALCLKALVDCDNWRFASDEMVNKVCQNVAVALEDKGTQTNAHMGLVMSLAKKNPLIMEAYARLLIHSGLRILNAGIVEANSQKRLSAIQMVNFLMKSLDVRSIFSELEPVMEAMQKCQSDQMAFVSGAAFEALQTAIKIITEKASKLEKTPASMTGSNFGNKEHRSNLNDNGVPMTPTNPESRTFNSFTGYNSVDSPNVFIKGNDCRSVTRKLWSHGGRVDISLKDGLFPGFASGGSMLDSCSDDSRHNEPISTGNSLRNFVEFFPVSPINRRLRSGSSSPQAGISCLNVENIDRIFTTPRKLIRSLQEPDAFDSDYSEKASRRFRSSLSVKYGAYDAKEFCNVNNDDQSVGISESVSSSNDIGQVLPASSAGNDNKCCQQSTCSKWSKKAIFLTAMALLIALIAILISVEFLGTSDEYYIVPT